MQSIRKRLKTFQFILKSNYFLRNFITLLMIMSIFFSIFAVYTYRNSKRIIQEEFITSSKNSTWVLSNSIDDYIMNVRYIAATLDTNNLVRTFLSTKNPEDIFTDIYPRIQEHLKAYVNSIPSIDSIYLYSAKAGCVLTAFEQTPVNYFSDTGWLDNFTEDPPVYDLFPRAMNGSYPYVLTLMKQIKLKDSNAAIVININLDKIPNLMDFDNSSYQDVYIINEDNRILFRGKQRALLEPLEVSPYLTNFVPNLNNQGLLITDENSPYTFSQVKSKEYGFYCVLITHLQEYTYRLTDSRAILMTLCYILFATAIISALLFSIQSFRPIQDIMNLLQDPASIMMIQKKSHKEITYIANHITSYVQANEQLSTELSARLNLLNETKLLAMQSQINSHFLFNTLNMIHILEMDALGYNHIIPKTTLSLSKLLRYAIDSTDLVTLDTELEYTKIYLFILNQRYGNNLKVAYNISTDINHIKVPKLFIQPLIENAVFHGFSKQVNEDSKLVISCATDLEYCTVSVEDNGIGMSYETKEKLEHILDDQTPPKGNIGFKNVIVRMHLLYGENFNLIIESIENKGSIFTFRFPILF